MRTVFEEGKGRSMYSLASNPELSPSSSPSPSQKLLANENLLNDRSGSKCVISITPYNAISFSP